jgi:hypothetical protein
MLNAFVSAANGAGSIFSRVQTHFSPVAFLHPAYSSVSLSLCVSVSLSLCLSVSLSHFVFPLYSLLSLCVFVFVLFLSPYFVGLCLVSHYMYVCYLMRIVFVNLFILSCIAVSFPVITLLFLLFSLHVWLPIFLQPFRVPFSADRVKKMQVMVDGCQTFN